jgi:DNA-binding transcriptional ArsR family regulator
MTLTALKLFKNLSDETRLGIVLLLREMGELCVCDFCTALDESQPKISRHLAMLRESGYCWIASRGNGFIIAYPRIFLPGLLR